jgi:hypothetical protein
VASEFTPGIARAQAAGYPIQASIYPPGAEGITLSCETIAQKIRDGRLDPHITQWAADVVIAAGKPKSVKARAQALLDACRAQFFYAPDPPGAERIASAAITACVSPGLCLHVGDCDDLTVLMGSAIMSLGIPVVVVKQNFGSGQQEHVLIKCEDEDGDWLGVDPSSQTLPVGHSFPAVSEVEFDPLDQISTATGSTEPEFVTLGALPAGVAGLLPSTVGVASAPRNVGLVTEPPAPPPRNIFFKDGLWIEYRYGTWWAYINRKWIKGTRRTPGLGAAQAPKYEARGGRWWFRTGDLDVELTDAQAKSFGLGAAPVGVADASTGATSASSTASTATAPTPTAGSFAQALTDLQNQVGLAIVAANTYLGESDYSSAVTAYQAAGMAGATSVGPEIDRIGPGQITKPYTQEAWTLNGQLAAISTTGATQATAQQAQGIANQMAVLYSQAIAYGTLAQGLVGGFAGPGQQSVGPTGPSVGAIALGALGLGLAGGAIVWTMKKRAA